MKIFKLVPLLAMAAILAVGCNKEDLNKQEAQGDDTQSMVKPLPCGVDTALDEHGMPLQPAPLSPELLAAAEMTKADQEYTIPVVFHIFGSNQGSGVLDLARMEKVLKWINNDFNGVKNVGDPEYFGNIFESRKEFVDFLPIKFVLAKNTKDGVALAKGQKVHGGKVVDASVANSGTISGEGSVIIYTTSHPLAKVGPGNETSVNAKLLTELKKVAWDNKMYMNVYISNMIKGPSSQGNESGIAWYPGTVPQGAERVVYNGAYLPGGNYWDKDFTSIISHEFGHFLNLPHTFDGGCVAGRADSYTEGDKCKDTPAMFASSDNPAYAGHGKKNCNGDVIDYGNFMNYGVYSNFTKDQVTRMKAALQLAQRKPLWQQSNLDKVLGAGGGSNVKDPATFSEKLDALNKK